MQYKNTVEAVYINLEELQQVVANMGTDGKIHAIDVDLAMDKLRHVYDLMISLKYEASHTVSGDIEIKQEAMTVIQEKVKEEIPAEPEIVIEQKSEPQVQKVEIKHEPKTVKKTEEEIKPETEKTKAELESRVRTAEGKKFLGEAFAKEKPSINEELSQKAHVSDVSSKLKSQPITSISNAIGLAEKFELIQNLFGGDKIKYEKTIEILNTAGNFNEAYDYLSSNFEWDLNNNIYAQRLLELIRRKLIVRKNEQ